MRPFLKPNLVSCLHQHFCLSSVAVFRKEEGERLLEEYNYVPVTCNSYYGICCSCPKLSGIPNKWHKKRRSECPHPSIPARETQREVRRRKGQHSVQIPRSTKPCKDTQLGSEADVTCVKDSDSEGNWKVEWGRHTSMVYSTATY